MPRARDPECPCEPGIDELLDALEGLPASERVAYLARVCPDPALRQEVLSTLAAESTSTGYLERLAGLVERLGTRRPTPPELTGRRIGAYRLLRPLGRGGMGVVYEAERADGAFEQRVALKLLAAALEGTEAHERFLAERQILADLKHPAIAGIVDGGVTEDGTPWFAMEHVEGEPIDAYCDRRQLDVRQRQELFLQVCDAVEHAHRRLVVHRDLKPANVLVTEDHAAVGAGGRGCPVLPPVDAGAPASATPQVKLLDFGIAKLLGAEAGALDAPPTRMASRLMTPEYASPEQVSGDAVTTASDVYQLGLLLYELLTGHRPYVLRHRSGGELERVICRQPPTRPSSVVYREDTLRSSTGLAVTTIEGACRARRSSPPRLRRTLRGDLDNIVLKALSKEPHRRYGSADRLAQDIRRHLARLPVAARAETWLYRGGKFFRRHALGVSTAAAVFLLAAGVTGFHTMRIQSERDLAQIEAGKAQQMSRFLVGMIRSVDPRKAGGQEITVRQALDRGVDQVDRDLAGQPEIQADLLQVLGRTHLELGHHQPAARLLTRALKLRRHRLGSNHPDVGRVLADLGLLRHRQGRYERARELLEAAARNLRTTLGGNAPELADALHALGETYQQLNEREAALATLRRALTIHREVSGDISLPAARILRSLGPLLYEMGLLEKAEDAYERALAVHEREFGPDHPQVGYILMNLATLRLEQGKLEGLETMYRRNLAAQRKAYGPHHVRVGVALNNLGHFLSVSGRDEEAVDVLRQALEVQNLAIGSDHPDIAYPLASLGDAHLAGGRLREARHYYRRCVAARERSLGGRSFDPVLVYGLVKLGSVQADLGNDVAAGQSLNRALAIWLHAPESTDPRLAPVLLDLGRWLAERRRCAAARPLLQRVARIHAAQQSPPESQAAELEVLLAGCFGSRGAGRVQPARSGASRPTSPGVDRSVGRWG